MPNNCTECEEYKTCKTAHYGGLGCKHKDEIVEATVKAERKNRK